MNDIPHGPGSDQKSNDEEGTQLEKAREADVKARQKWAQRRAKMTAPWIQEIVPGLFLGHLKTSWNSELLKANWIGAMVSLTDRRWAFWDPWTRDVGVPESRHKWVQCMDSSTQDLLIDMEDICDFIDRNSPLLQLLSILPAKDADGLAKPTHASRSHAVLVHSDKGLSRSPTAIIAYLMRKYGARLEEALAFVHAKRAIEPSAEMMRQLEVWEEVEYKLWEDEEKLVPKFPYQAFLNDQTKRLKEEGLTGDEPFAPTSL